MSEEALHKHDPRVACPANHDNDDDADAWGTHLIVIFHPKNFLEKAVSCTVTTCRSLCACNYIAIILYFTMTYNIMTNGVRLE
jgi:hypothetical protein